MMPWVAGEEQVQAQDTGPAALSAQAVSGSDDEER